MQYKTHLSTSLVVALPVMSATDTLTIGTVLAVGLGAVFPDIDEPHSWIGSRTRGISDFIKGFFGHRGLTHSLMGLFIVFLTMVLMVSFTPFSPIIGLYFILGYLLHLVGDSFSKSGVKWLLPFSDKAFQSGLGIVYYRTGFLAERIIFIVSMLLLVAQVRALNFESLFNLNIVQALSNVIKNATSFIGS